MNIKIDLADKIMSYYIRKRDGKCVRCGTKVQYNEKGLPNSHQASHYWSRKNESTRFDTENIDTLCFYCHRLWGGDYRREYEKFKINQLGQTRYDLLQLKAHSYKKKDRKMELIIAKELLKTVL